MSSEKTPDKASSYSLPDTLELNRRDDRLCAMKDLVAQIAHSFNNSLAPMAGYVALLGEELKPATSGAQHLARFESSMRKAQVLVEAILEATHPQRRFFPRPTDFKLLIERTTERWIKALPASARISVETRAVPCILTVDESQWERVLHHLLRNAELALRKGGVIQIELEFLTLSAAECEPLGLAHPEVALLTIRDTGCGMPGDVLRRAYDPLFTVHAHGPTAGLGLTLAHGVVQLHGGQIWIESAEGEGTTVRIWLPRA